MSRPLDAAVALATPLARRAGPAGLERLAAWLGPAVALVRRQRRHHLRAALRRWLGLHLPRADERRLLERAVAAELGRQLELLLLADLPQLLQGGLVELEHPERLRQALAHGRGLVLATSHAGPHHLAGLGLSAAGCDVAEVAVAPARVDRLLPDPSPLGSALRRAEQRARQALPVRHLPLHAGPGSLRQALRWLGRGGALVMPGDGLWGQGNLLAPFFAGRVRMPSGGPRLAWLAGAPLLFGGLHAQGQGRWTLRLGESRLPPDERGPTRQTAAQDWIRDSVQRYACQLQAQVRRDPALYLWRLGTIHRLQSLGAERFFEAPRRIRDP